MTSLQLFQTYNQPVPTISVRLFEKYSSIAIDSQIHSGWPHIKGTRILVTDIFKASVSGHSLPEMVLTFKEMGVQVTESQLTEACRFTVEWLYLLNEQKK